MSQTTTDPADPAGAWPPSPTSPTPAVTAAPRNLSRDLFFIAYAAFITTLAQDKVLGLFPIRLWLKDHLHCDRTQVATFAFISGFAWYIKPVFGLIADAFPIFGTRRRWYMIGASLLAAVAWIVMSLGQAQYNTFLAGAVLLGVMMVFGSTIMGAMLVEAGQKYGATGRVSAVREFVQDGCYIITGPISGWLALQAFGVTAGIGATLLVSLAVAAFFFLKEKPLAQRNASVWQEAGQQLRLVFASKTLWAAAGLIVLYFFTPGFSTPLLYRQTDMLHFSPVFLGTLTTVSGIGQILGALTYGVVCRRFQLKPLLNLGIVLTAASSLLYLSYHPTHTIAMGIEFVAGYLAVFGALPLYDLATRGTPLGGEGMGYALMMSARNVALFGADVVGSKILDTFKHFPWNDLVLLNAGTTLICLIVIPFLPKALMKIREGHGQNLGDPEATGEQVSGPEPGPHAP